jgi:two-component system OmpR family sensor kinase
VSRRAGVGEALPAAGTVARSGSIRERCRLADLAGCSARVLAARLSGYQARRGRLACLERSDGGPGIPRERLPRVFDRLWRASPVGSDGGSGLGLAIAARICRALGGEIEVASAPGRRSRFVVELPLVAPGR